MEETALIQRAREGDTAAFARLVQAYQTPVYNLTYRMLGERMEAEDAAQETFVRAFRNLHRYDVNRSFKTWLFSIASHYCIDCLRRHRPTFSLNTALTRASDAHGPEARVIQSESRERVQGLLMELPPTDRMAVTLLYWYDYSYEEIAEMLNLTVGAVKSRLFRARRAMAQSLEEEAYG